VTLTHPSPNFGERKGGAAVELVVLHYTVLDCAGSLARLCDPLAEVSAHYLIDRDGSLHTLVDETERAWHAGSGAWGGRGDVNSRSIGIELVNRGDDPFPEPQMAALERVLRDILQRHRLGPQAVIAHSDMAPDRKTDPGARFDWRRLALQGLSVWPDPAASHPSATKTDAGPDSAGFLADLQAFGYPDGAPETLLSAFRLRFRPWATGAMDATDCALAAALRRFAVDANRTDA
jgi:N-acetylmuramoyl-L-alanine amidase